nr:hypothetical protein [Tanacetum cinerariifolium]
VPFWNEKWLVQGDTALELASPEQTATDWMLLFHDPAVFDVPAGFFISAIWLFAAVLECSCCWKKDAVLELTNPKSSQDDGFKPLSDDGKKVDEDPSKGNECYYQEKEDNVNSTNNVNTISSNINAAGINRVNVVGELPFDPDMPALKDIGTFDFSNEDEDDDAVADMNNLDTTIQVSPTPTIRIYKDHHLDQVIRDLQSTTQTRNMLKNLEEHGFVSTIHQRTNHKDLQ